MAGLRPPVPLVASTQLPDSPTPGLCGLGLPGSPTLEPASAGSGSTAWFCTSPGKHMERRPSGCGCVPFPGLAARGSGAVGRPFLLLGMHFIQACPSGSTCWGTSLVIILCILLQWFAD
ncbi:hypothetical protein AAFF_G00288850 [Aldrovandia affinis]|uniref:Uncharacterized protein n=1 Tax=Aldrovandia affinis TaxID=143900 RepID=A0AAD7SQX6_9TELE|nr:hypothetical protein AAFF_G00288850 [Aldrovandia affinis]